MEADKLMPKDVERDENIIILLFALKGLEILDKVRRGQVKP